MHSPPTYYHHQVFKQNQRIYKSRVKIPPLLTNSISPIHINVIGRRKPLEVKGNIKKRFKH
jgi:hypothetical protein